MRVYRVYIYVLGYAVSIYDNVMRFYIGGDFIFSVYYINVGAFRDCSSIFLEDSRDYVNVFIVKEIVEILVFIYSFFGYFLDFLCV